jgi:hypothetical protein
MKFLESFQNFESDDDLLQYCHEIYEDGPFKSMIEIDDKYIDDVVKSLKNDYMRFKGKVVQDIKRKFISLEATGHYIPLKIKDDNEPIIKYGGRVIISELPDEYFIIRYFENPHVSKTIKCDRWDSTMAYLRKVLRVIN